jgi:hypothetical protein
MNNNLCTICGGYSYCSCTSGESQITSAVLWMTIHKNLASLRVSLGFPHWLGDSPRCSQTFHNRSHGAPIPVIRDFSYSEGRPECPPRVWYSPEIGASKFTLHILSDTPGGSQWLKYIVLMQGGIRKKRDAQCIPGWTLIQNCLWRYSGTRSLEKHSIMRLTAIWLHSIYTQHSYSLLQQRLKVYLHRLKGLYAGLPELS